jgi:dihydroflavonol-4-reductase
LLDAAAAAGVRRAVVAGSALGVGVNRDPVPLDESADHAQHAFELPYATIRREAEVAALRRATPAFAVVSVCPSFTFGPDDPTGAPANKLLAAIASRKVRFTLRVGFGCLDVRDFAAGALRAAESGRSGERYLLSGDNVTATELAERVAAIVGIRPPRLTIPAPVLHVAVAGMQLFYRVRGTSAPVTREVLQIVGRYAWYDTTKARTDLGWTARPLEQTLRDTLAWQQSSHRERRAPRPRAPV